MTYAYARVSSKDQNEARQIAAFSEIGITGKAVVVDHESGKDFNRTHYVGLRRRLKDGDTLVVMSLDRFGRNYDMIIEEWRYLTKTKGVSIRVLDMPILNTTESAGLTGKLISDIVLQLLSYVAQMEREHIHERQAQGIAAAKARGVHFGRARYPMPDNFDRVAEDLKNGVISYRMAARMVGCSHTTFLKRCKELGIVRMSYHDGEVR